MDSGSGKRDNASQRVARRSDEASAVLVTGRSITYDRTHLRTIVCFVNGSDQHHRVPPVGRKLDIDLLVGSNEIAQRLGFRHP